MPILEDQTGCPVFVFGSGDICIAVARHPYEACPNELAFIPVKAGVIGRDVEEHKGKTTMEVHAEARLQFTDVESLTVLIEQATELRDQMLAARKGAR